MWPVALSGRLPVVALVSRYLTNKLIGRESIPDRKTFHAIEMPLRVVSGISSGFPGLSQSLGQVTHVLLTRSPLITQEQALEVTVRLACVKHAASVRPEPGSNSPLMFKPQQPKGRREKQTPKGRFQPSRTSQTDSIHNQPKKNSPTNSNPKATTIKRGQTWHRFLARC